jgi:hypothetical protein
MARNTQRGFCIWTLPALLLAAGCNIGKVSRVVVVPPNANSATRACNLLSQSGPGCPMNQPLEIRVFGRAPCTLLEVEFGDGEKTEVRNFDFAKSEEDLQAPLVLTHTYKGWPGPKRVKAAGVTNCAGTATTDFDLLTASGTPSYRLGFQQPVPTACTPVPGTKPLRPGTLARVETTDVMATNYGCPLGGCVYGADGKPGSQAPAQFPFPGLREFSQVWRVGTQIEQGGSSASFTVRERGPLEVCVNDDNLPDNHGAWRVDITVDERNAR